MIGIKIRLNNYYKLVSGQIVNPWVFVGTSVGLARRPLSGITPEFQLALLGRLPGASSGPVSEFAAKCIGGQDGFQRLRILHPTDQFLAGDKVDIGQGQNGVDEREEALLSVRPVEEPGGVEVEWERSLVLGVVVQEVLREDLLDGGRVLLVVASVSHGARAAPDIFQGGHGDLPHARMRLSRAGLDRTRMRHLVFEGVRPSLLRGGHGAVVVEAVPPQGPEHLVSSDLQEGSAHAFDILGIDSGIADQHLGHANELVGPLDLVEALAIRVGDSVGGDLVTVGIHVLDLAVVRPFVRNVERRLERAAQR